ncbi:glycoside hydrolase family 1 protein [Hypoxylon sp. CI-4A]|nr:glycoside hydrolase family 1 protein [Hypoxylon sp. CI-4A]
MLQLYNPVSFLALAIWSKLGCYKPTTTSHSTSLPSTRFSWPPYADLHYATPLPKPTATSTYAPPYSELSSLAGSQTVTTWSSVASPTDSASKFGNVAWSSLWGSVSVDPPPFTTTASPTPVPTTELIKPTPLPFSIGVGETDEYRFPTDFDWGFTGSAVQVEGAVKTEGRGPGIIDVKLREVLPGSASSDISVLNYFLYKQDIARLAAAGVKSYGFKYGMKPIVSLHHVDTLLYYETNTSLNGFDHPEFVDGFLNYVKIVLAHYSDRISTWITFSEPNLDSGFYQNWASSYNVVIAHAKTVHFYREQIQGSAQWSLKLAMSSGGFPLPLDPQNPDDVAASERQLDFSIGYIAAPIFLGSQVPSNVIESLGPSAPNYTDKELRYVKGTADFFAVDLYNAWYAIPLDGDMDSCIRNRSHPQFPMCSDTTTVRSNWQIGDQSNATPWTFYQHARTIFNYFSVTYPTTGGIFVAEFGWPGFHEYEMTKEHARAEFASTLFYLPVLNEMLKAAREDGVKFKGALSWAYIDNWEFGQYDDRFGVQAFNNETLERSYKRSMFDIVDFISAHSSS